MRIKRRRKSKGIEKPDNKHFSNEYCIVFNKEHITQLNKLAELEKNYMDEAGSLINLLTYNKEIKGVGMKLAKGTLYDGSPRWDSVLRMEHKKRGMELLKRYKKYSAKKCWNRKCSVKKSIEFAHILPVKYNRKSNLMLHKNNILNLIPMCSVCHKGFDRFRTGKKNYLAEGYIKIITRKKIKHNKKIATEIKREIDYYDRSMTKFRNIKDKLITHEKKIYNTLRTHKPFRIKK